MKIRIGILSHRSHPHEVCLTYNYLNMHKNIYNPKTLNGNWFENRFTDDFDKKNDETSNTYLANPSFNKYVTTSKAIGNAEPYSKVSV